MLHSVRWKLPDRNSTELFPEPEYFFVYFLLYYRRIIPLAPVVKCQFRIVKIGTPLRQP